MRRTTPPEPDYGHAGALVLALGIAALACAGAPPREQPDPGATTPDTTDTAALPIRPDEASTPRVRGSLDWEDLSVRMVGREFVKGLQIDVTTLNEEALELASDDVRAFFEEAKRRVPDAVPPGAAEELTPFLVGFTGFEKEISFDPTRLQIESEGSTHYPRYIVPVSRKFERKVVDLYETLYGVYLFEAELDLNATLTFRYGPLSTGSTWRRVVENIQRAKSRLEGGGR